MTHSEELWDDVAGVALGMGAPGTASKPESVAGAINAHAAEDAYDAEVVRRLVLLAQELRHDHRDSSAEMRERVSQLVGALSPAVLRRIASLAGDSMARRDYLIEFNEGFMPDVVLQFVLSGIDPRKQKLSPPLVRLLSKLASQATSAAEPLRTAAGSGFRQLVRDLIARWWLVAPDSYSFAQMFSEQQPASQMTALGGADADRVVQMSVEIDAMGSAVWTSVSTMVDGGRLRDLLEILKAAPKENEAVRQIIHHLATPTLLRAALRSEPVDFEVVERLLEPMGINAARLLLDEMAESQSRKVRQGIFDRLSRMGTELGPLVVERLQDKRWYVERNLLALLSELEYWPDDLSLETYTGHVDDRVRKEAIRFLLKIPEKRDQAILSALKQTDISLVRIGLMAVTDYGSEAAVPLLTKRIAESDFPPDMRLIAIRLLQRSKSGLALEALLKLVDGGRNFWNKPKLASRSPEMLAALSALNAGWPRERRASVFLDLARSAKEDDVRAAVGAA